MTWQMPAHPEWVGPDRGPPAGRRPSLPALTACSVRAASSTIATRHREVPGRSATEHPTLIEDEGASGPGVGGSQERVELFVGPGDASTSGVDADRVGAGVTPSRQSVGEPGLLV